MPKINRKGVYIAGALCIILLLAAYSYYSKVNEPVFSKVTKVNESNLTEKQWMEDIDYLHKNLPKHHKNLYHDLKKEDFDKEITNLKNDIPNLKPYEIKVRLAEIIALVKDAHTSLSIESDDENIYPIGLSWFGMELRVVSADRQYKDIIGAKLTKINGINADELMGKINRVIPHENGQWLRATNVRYIVMPDVLKSLNVTTQDKTEFSFIDKDGKEKKLILAPEKLTSSNIVRGIDLAPIKPIRAQNDTKDPNSQLYWYKYVPEDKILYFQYNQCIDREVAKEYGEKDYNSLPDFNEFSKGLIDEINNKDVDKFVIDLRYNPGGNSKLMTDFVSKLNNIQKLKGKGKIFVLTGRQTFSSGVWACLDLKKQTKAIFYGEPTGGNVNGYGDIKMLTLPNSHWQISYSTKLFNLSDDYKEGFIPDVFVDQSFDNYMKGIDDIYEAVKNYKG
ncbi:hypothetical protein I6U48_03900 [Clostridium sp. PL3]|uniref:Tail specific protease domain-containing protein n=1 Tax=Clostridium thailandense TaxID=2794346 RepID=A0A949WQ07_9CLOT|nr:S41 family peptidase [Clostridium thailandense]MBV7272060.1 hypothetical protein [Clostridium thailandense]